MANYWIKLYQEILDDSKMALLPDRLWRRVIELFLIAGRTNKDGNLPDTEEIAWILRKSIDKIESDLNAIKDTGIIVKTQSGWFIPKYAQRQSPSTSTERSQQFRNKEKKNQYSDNKLCGIYKIKCNQNNKVYVGASVDIEHRIKVHFIDSQLNSHWLHQDMELYGKDQFSWEVLELIDDIDDLAERETYWIKLNKENLYNRETKGKQHRDRMSTNVQRSVAQITDTDTEHIRTEQRGKYDPNDKPINLFTGK